MTMFGYNVLGFGGVLFNRATSVEYLVVAGGAGGAGGGGGGGAGGFRTATGLAVTGSLTVTVGAGGAGITSASRSMGNSGSDSVFSTITSCWCRWWSCWISLCGINRFRLCF